MASRSIGHRAPLLWLALPLAAGLSCGEAGGKIRIPLLLTVAAGFATLALIAGWRGWRYVWAPALSFALIAAGMASYALNRPRLEEWDELPPREVRLSIRIDRIFAQNDPRKAVGLATILRAAAPVQELAGQKIYFDLWSMRKGVPPRGTIATVRGVIAALPRAPPASTFDGFLAAAGINFRLNRGRVLAEETPASTYRSVSARMLDQLSALLGAGVAHKRPELVGVLRAMLLGQQHELNEEQKSLFRQSGTMHIFSISGLHITVIAVGLQALLTLARLPMPVAIGLGLSALWLYVDITGTAPSAVRAFVMVAFMQLAFVLRLPRNPLSALTASALLVLLMTPLDLFSASFQMSYGIVAALLLLGLPLVERWNAALALFADLPKGSWQWHHRWRDAAWRAAISAIGLGVATSLVSAVTGANFFELFTPGALLANLWVIPVSSLVILLGLVSLLSGLAGLAGVTVLANHAAVLVLWLVDLGIRVNLELPGMWFGAAFRLPGLGAFGLCAVLAAIFSGYSNGWTGWCRWFWPPFAVVGILLIFGVKFGAP